MSMTALVSAFARAYHAQREGTKIYCDSYARALLTDGEYQQIATQMSAGVSFFDPAFQGNGTAALRRVMDGYLSPTPLARAAYGAQALADSQATQLLVLGAGYDTLGLNGTVPVVFEVDRPEVLADKQARLERLPIPNCTRYVPADLAQPDWTETLTAQGFDPAQRTFCTAMGLVYYLTAVETEQLFARLSGILAIGSQIALDVPTVQQKLQRTLAAGAGEPMKAALSRQELEALAAHCGFCLREYLLPADIQARFFDPYNAASPDAPMYAPPDVAYALLEKA